MKKIKDLRKERGISQVELADSIGVKQATVSRWEQNQLTIIGTNLIKLAEFFEVSTDSLLGVKPKDK